MRWLSLLTLSAVLSASAFAADVELVRVWPQWRNADAFDRVTEYLGRPDNQGRITVLRTRSEERSGLYFVVRLKTTAAVPDARFVLEVIRPDSPDPKAFTFPVSVPAKGRVFELGLTDGDWPGGRDAQPVAWKVTVLDQADQVLASEQSFLWAMPDK